MLHPAALPIDELLTECQVTRTRGSGPGGQHRNKTETAIVITHTPTGIRGEASERRSQAENLAQAKHRLRVELALAVRTGKGVGGLLPQQTLPEEPSPQRQKAPDPLNVPSELWQTRAKGQRITVSTSHDDFPALLAEALDALAAADWAAPATAEQLGVSTSQLIKFLKQEPRALALLNRIQTERGLRPYR
ncbi:peptide chain release factor family protein [Lacipirellula sp.]|uniref:peptide chain release factor family protein n=1 Tax=Lacipirellula sp. TaxID=2691419 RepID=UPI003D0BC6BA